jgi:integrase/recombinase XerD
MTETRQITIHQGAVRTELAIGDKKLLARDAPAIIGNAGANAEYAWEEFFQGEIANPHTRKNYFHAVRQFLTWAEARNVALLDLTPGLVGKYFQELDVGVPTKKLHLAALRKFFDRMVNRHALYINPAATVRAERYSIVEGKTPEIQRKQAETLIRSIETVYVENAETRPDLVGLRDRAVLTVLAFTAARVGAVSKLTFKSLRHDGSQYSLRFAEKGGKSREIPVRHDVQKLLLAYIEAAGITDGPLFRTTTGKTGILTERAMTGIDICRMMKRRLKAAGLPGEFSPHSFRVTTVTESKIRLWRTFSISPDTPIHAQPASMIGGGERSRETSWSGSRSI